MGMGTSVVGIRPPDEKWRKMKAIYDACTAAGIEVPQEVDNFFDGGAPDAAGVVVDVSAERWASDDAEGLEVDVTALPKDVTRIRFYNSW